MTSWRDEHWEDVSPLIKPLSSSAPALYYDVLSHVSRKVQELMGLDEPARVQDVLNMRVSYTGGNLYIFTQPWGNSGYQPVMVLADDLTEAVEHLEEWVNEGDDIEDEDKPHEIELWLSSTVYEVEAV
jgi:hypothetical protein